LDNNRVRVRETSIEGWAKDALVALTVGVVIIDSSRQLVYANPAAARLLGVANGASAHCDWSNRYGFFRSNEQTPVRTEELPIVRALKGETTREALFFIHNAAAPGVYVRVSSAPLRDGQGWVRGAVCLMRDLTAPRTQEMQPIARERGTMAVLDNVPDIAWLKDCGGTLLAVNEAFARVARRGCPELVIGATDFDLWPRDVAERYRHDDEEVMRTGINKRVEEPFVEADGTVRWVETFKTRVVGNHGEVIGTTGISRDITERKRAEEALRVTNRALEERVRERTAKLAEAQENLVRKERLAVLGQLAGGVAHQIRNPLAAIMNATYVLKRHLLPDQHPNIEDAIRIIHDEVRHANVIITGLLDFARVRAPDRHPTSVVELLDRVLQSDWMPRTVRVVRHIEEVPLLDVDADQLHGAFFNVIRNAVEAMAKDGEVRVAVRSTGDAILIAISDTGPGISPQVRAHLFEPLHSTKPMGIGLGLVTARTFIEAHGGRISNVDVPEGARFEIRLPLDADTETMD